MGLLTRTWSAMPFVGRLLVTASIALLVAGTAMLWVSARQEATEIIADLRSELARELHALPAALAETVIIGDYATLQQGLDSYVARPVIAAISFRDSTGTLVHSMDVHVPREAPAWFLGLFEVLDIEGGAAVTVGGRTYGELRLTLTARGRANRAWRHLQRHMEILLLAVLLDFLGIWLVLRQGLRPLQRLEEGTRALANGRLDSRLPEEGSPELRRLITSFNSMALSIQNAQQSLRDSEERLQLAIKGANDGLWDWNLLTNEVYLAPRWKEMVGYRDDELPNALATFESLLCPDDRSRVLREIERCHRGDIPVFALEFRLRRKDGGWCWVLSRGEVLRGEDARPVRMVGYNTDISERKAQEERIGRLATAMEHAAEEIFITDVQGNIVYVNPAQRSLTGFADEEVIGRELALFALEGGDGTETRQIREALRRGQKWEGRLQVLTRNGTPLLMETIIVPIRDADGQVAGSVCTRRDITRQVATERQLSHAQKMEAIGSLAGGIAHDFNNILAAIMGFTELAIMQADTGGTMPELLSHIQKGCIRARDLVRQILAFSRRAEQRKAPLELRALVKESLQLLRASIPSTIEIRQEITSPATILADITQVHQVILNLCTNAYQAMGEKGGILAVSLRDIDMVADEPVLASDDLPAGRYVVLEVSDNGCGMDNETMKNIFEPYFTTKPMGQGTGLGLAVVHGIVKSHGGRISVYSEPGHGTRFRVYFPVVDACVLNGTSGEPAQSPRGNNERIMFVDDEQEIRRFVGQMLPGFGYRIDLFAEGASALARLRQDPLAYDLLITDMSMPLMDGKTLAREALALRPDLPVILCTGYSALINADRARAMGIQGYIQKPVHMLDLLALIRKTLESAARP